jgi:polysaccharide export outer membrane protein
MRVEVFQEEDLYKEVRVAADGTVVLPLIGRVEVAGLTVPEAQEKIRNLYDKDYLVDPQINLLVLEYSQRRVHVLGQVNEPGYVLIPPEEDMTLTQAITGARGMTLRADGSNVKVKRTTDGQTRVYIINVNEILRNPDAKNVPLYDGDTVYVEERLF